MPSHGVFAQTDRSASVNLNQETVDKGYTLTLEDGAFHVAIAPGIIDQPAILSIRQETIVPGVMPAGWVRVSPVFTYDLKTETRPAFGQGLILAIRSEEDSLYLKRMYFFDGRSGAWRPLKSVTNNTNDSLSAYAHFPYAQVALFSSHTSLVGQASWYRSASHPNGVASNDFPLGSSLRVTNLETKKASVVTVVSTGPFVKGRVVDLALPSFRRIASKGDGVVTVRVELIKLGPGGGVKSIPPPKISAAAGFVYRPSDQSVLFDQKANTIRSLASITKLMTALVVLDSNPTLAGTLSFSDEDWPIEKDSVTIRVNPGDTLSVRDTFFAMLTGSANNAALALSRSTGLSHSDFIAAMNTKAKTIGMTTAVFVDPSGISVGNLGTAVDVGILINSALNNSVIRSATLRRNMTYTIRNTGERRTISNPIFQGSTVLNDEPIVGGKTGYINESLYNLGVGATVGGERIIAVVLGDPTRYTRNLDIERLIHFAQNMVKTNG